MSALQQTQPGQASSHSWSAEELKERNKCERAGAPFLMYRDDAGKMETLTLERERKTYVIGRAADSDLQLVWDRKVSRVHAELHFRGGLWTIADDGLSTNGTFVGTTRIAGAHRLAHKDTITCGRTTLVFWHSSAIPAGLGEETTDVDDRPQPPKLTGALQRVADVLCNPPGGALLPGQPASNKAIAEALYLEVTTVKTHVRALYQRFGLDNVDDRTKRQLLVAELIKSGAVTVA
jgi:pSer/pThr/pTyr-binding forkhead associated (FHA) protein